MKKILIGEKLPDKKYGYRETCFGICEQNGKMLVVKKNNQYSLIGGGIEENESKLDCLKREFLEEAGYAIKFAKELVTIDCFWLAGGKWPLESVANIFVVEVEPKHSAPLEEGHILQEIDTQSVLDILPLPYHKKALEYYFEHKHKK